MNEESEITPAHIRFAAMNFLSMREHSAKELQIKLSKKFEQREWIESSIEKLKHDGLQSDKRFAEAFVAMRLRQGKGSVVIRLELKEKGIDGELINEILLDVTDWNTIALKAYTKKFGDSPSVDLKEKARRIRFLASRGFSSTTINYVLSHTAEID